MYLCLPTDIDPTCGASAIVKNIFFLEVLGASQNCTCLKDCYAKDVKRDIQMFKDYRLYTC